MKYKIAIGLTIVFLSVLFFEWLRHPLPILEGRLQILGLENSVDVYTDPYGVPHVYADNERDLFFAAGYIAARDRLFQLSMVSLAVRGGLASVLGPDYLKTDVYFRTWKIHDTAIKMVENMDVDNKEIFKSFCDGINYRVGEVMDDLPVEFKILGFKPDHWTPETVAGYARMMAHEMSGAWKPEVLFGAIESYFGNKKLKELLPDVSVDHPTIVPNERLVTPSLFSNVLNNEYKLRNLFGDFSADIGSNNWVVSPSRSETGKAFLANDPHLAFTQPPRWYEIHLSGGRFDVSGVCIAGIPLPVIGQNKRTAWGFTNSMVDDLDFYIEEINKNNINQYKHDSEWLEIDSKKEVFSVKGKMDTVIYIRSTHHGPIVTDIHHLATGENTVLSMAWTGHWITNELDAWVELTTMKDWDDFSTALSKFGVPGQNIVYADIDGNIGWRPAVYVPIRKAGFSMAPRPGWNSTYDWDGVVPYEDMPFMYNPESGFIATANNRTIDKDFPYYISGLWADPSRASRIVEMLNEKEKYNIEDMKSIQLDLTSNFSKEILPYILGNTGDLNSNAQTRAIRFLKEWDHIESVDSEATLVFHSICNEIIKNIYYDELSLLGEHYFKTFVSLKYITKRCLRSILKGKPNSWVDDIRTKNKKETIEEIIQRSTKSGVEMVVSKYGPNWSNWKWGEAHSLTHKHILGRNKILNYLFNFNIGPFLSGGSDVTPNAGGYSLDNGFYQTSGASMRRIVDFSNLNNTQMIIPTGQSGLHRSPHYSDQAELYHKGLYRTTWFDRDSIINRVDIKHLELYPK